MNNDKNNKEEYLETEKKQTQQTFEETIKRLLQTPPIKQSEIKGKKKNK